MDGGIVHYHPKVAVLEVLVQLQQQTGNESSEDLAVVDVAIHGLRNDRASAAHGAADVDANASPVRD